MGRTGVDAQWGFKAESTWATPVTVDTFLPLVSETMAAVPERIESNAIIAGRRVLTSDEWGTGRMQVGGGIQTELFDRDIATLISHMMGAASSPYTPGDLYGYGLTMQLGVPDTSGTVRPKTYAGCKITNWQLGCQLGQVATLGFDVIAAREILYRQVTDGVTNTDTSLTSATAAFTDDDIGKPVSGTGIAAGTTIASVTNATTVVLSQATTATASGVTVVIGIALASASYTSGLKRVYFVSGSVTIAGSEVKVKNATLSGNNGFDTDRFALGGRETQEPISDSQRRDYMATLDPEFVDDTQYLRYLNGTEHALVLTFATGSGLSFVITTNVRFDGETPKVSGRGIVRQNLPMKCVASGADSTAISMALTEAS